MALALLNLQENSSSRVYIWGWRSFPFPALWQPLPEISRKIYIHLPDSQGQEMALKHQENGLLGFLKLHAGHGKEHVWDIKTLFKSIPILKGYSILIAWEEAILADKWEQVINTGKLGTSCYQEQCKNRDLSMSWNPVLLVSSSLRRQSGFLNHMAGVPGNFGFSVDLPLTHCMRLGKSQFLWESIFSLVKWKEQPLLATQDGWRLSCCCSGLQTMA